MEKQKRQTVMSMFKDMLSSGSKISSKRVITFLAFKLLAIAFLCNLFFNWTIDATLLGVMASIVLGGLGLTASENFKISHKKEEPKEVLPKEDEID